METASWYDKSTWGDGPWQDEPDRVEWRSGDLPCLALRNHLGGWCGYVGLPPGHPWHGHHFHDLEDVSVHHGLTYSEGCDDNPDVAPAERICHVPAPGESDAVWWLGFDCGHATDFLPAMAARERELGLDPQLLASLREWTTYKNLSYVRAEVDHLAHQAADASRPRTREGNGCREQ